MPMQDQGAAPSHARDTLVDGAYAVDFSKPLPDAGGGLKAYPAHHVGAGTLRRNLMAVQVPAGLPPLASSISAFAGALPFALAPLAHGAARGPDRRMVQLVVGFAPPGPPLCSTALPTPGMLKPWAEQDLYRHVLTPAAATLETMRELHVPHRAIRIDNMFRSAPDAPVMLGAFWAAASASLQPVVYEPPYVGMCRPAARGTGSIADDVYALGVTLLVLATGVAPMAGLSDPEIVAAKLEVGSFAALANGIRLPSSLAELIREMLAEDPDHRPPPSLLANLSAARARKVASRPRQRVSKALEVGPLLAWDTRSAAYAMFREPDVAARLLRSGAIDQWLRRSLGDSALATQIEEVARNHLDDADAEGDGIMRAICILDPLAPLCWRGLAFWPDAAGTMLCSATEPGMATKMDETLQNESIGKWAMLRPERCNVAALKLDARHFRTLLRQPGWSGGRPALRYTLNPLLPLASPLVDGHVVTRLSDLLPALEACDIPGGTVSPAGVVPAMPLDRETCAFIASRGERADADILAITQAKEPDTSLAALRLLAGLQTRFADAQRFPKLTARLARQATRAIDTLRNRPRRLRIAALLDQVVLAGHLPSMLGLLDDPHVRSTDKQDGQQADEDVDRIDGELAALAVEVGMHAETAARTGAEIAAAVGAAALFATVVAMAVA